MLVSDIDFGDYAAEADLIRSDKKIFVETKNFKRISLKKNRIVFGRKGAGKTAYCIEFSKHTKNRYTYYFHIDARKISFHPFIELYGKLSENIYGTIDLKKKIAKIWEYSIITNCMVVLYQNRKEIEGFDKTIISKFLFKEKITTSSLYDLLIKTIGTLPYYIGESQGKATEKIIANIEEFPGKDINFDDAFEAFASYLKSHNISFLLSFDHLDTYFETKHRDNPKQQLVRDAIQSIIEGLINLHCP